MHTSIFDTPLFLHIRLISYILVSFYVQIENDLNLSCVDTGVRGSAARRVTRGWDKCCASRDAGVGY